MKLFKLKNQNLEVNFKKYLLPMLTKTSKDTKYWEPPKKKPNDKDIKRYLSSKALQLHQFLDIAKSLNISFKNKKLLDIGSGNCLITKMLLKFTNLSQAIGTDPFDMDEHLLIPNSKKSDEIILEKFLLKKKKFLKFENYKSHLAETAENYSFAPSDYQLKKFKNKKNFRFKKLDANELELLNQKFDIVYCKALEHIPNWKNVFKQISKVTKRNSVLYFKHRSFFSYLGPHRYATSGIPWGHLLLNDANYKRYINTFHRNRSQEMKNFFFNGLAYPRYTVSQLIEIASKNGFVMKCEKVETPSYLNKLHVLTRKKNFWNNIKKNYPTVSSEELFSSVYHIVFQKIN